jgi:hypothetical protein
MQRGVKYCHGILQRGVISLRCIMQRGVKLMIGAEIFPLQDAARGVKFSYSILQLGYVTHCCILQPGVKSRRCVLQPGVKSYRCMMQRGVKSYNCMMQRGVKSKNFGRLPRPLKGQSCKKSHMGTFTILVLCIKTRPTYNFLTRRCMMQRGVKPQILITLRS